MDPFNIFRLLEDWFGRNYGIALFLFGAALVGVFFYYWVIRLPDGDDFSGRKPKAQEQRTAYSEWRNRLAEGGRISAIYKQLLESALSRVDRFFGDGERQEPAYWTSSALDRCLLIAVVYPILSLIFIWHFTGYVGAAEMALQLPDGTSGVVRMGNGFTVIILMVSYVWAFNPPLIHQTPKWRALRFAALALAGGVASILVYKGIGAFIGLASVAFALAIAVAFAFAGLLTYVGAGAIAFAGAFAVAFAFAFAFAFVFVGAFVVGLAFPVAFVFAFAFAFRRFAGHIDLALFIFIMFYLVLIPLLVWGLSQLMGRETVFSWTLLVFFGALPLINAVFDWLSLGLTRLLLRYGLKRAGWWPVLFAMIDVVAATALLFVLLVVSLAYIELLNVVSVASGGGFVLDLEATFELFRTSPDSPALWWIYITIFTTFIPSMANLILGGLACLRGIGPLRAFLLEYALPERPQRLTRPRRFGAALGLTAQFGVVLAGAIIVGLSALFMLLYGLDVIGLGLFTVAEWAYQLIKSLGA